MGCTTNALTNQNVGINVWNSQLVSRRERDLKSGKIFTSTTVSTANVGFLRNLQITRKYGCWIHRGWEDGPGDGEGLYRDR